jgi:hypothetical protein
MKMNRSMRAVVIALSASVGGLTLFSASSRALAEEVKPVGVAEHQDVYFRLVQQEATLKAAIQQVRSDQGLSSDEREKKLAIYRANLQKASSERRSIERRLLASDRKYRKAVRDEEKVEDLIVDIAKAQQDEKLSEEQRTAKIEGLQSQILALKDRVGRKERGYERKVGEEMPGSFGTRSTRSPGGDEEAPGEKVSKVPSLEIDQPKPKLDPYLNKNPVTDREKMKFEECWQGSARPTETSVFAHFPIGKSEIKRGGKSEEDQLREIFDRDVLKVLDEMKSAGNQRVHRIEATGFASTIPMRSKSLEMLSLERGDFAASNFFSTAGVDQGHLEMKAAGYETRVVPSKSPVVGPAWTPSDYSKLKATKVTDQDLRATAERILASSDPTPVKVEGNVEATIERLKACCSSSLATLKYQPYQFMELKIYGARFTPNSQSCIERSAQVSSDKAKPNIPANHVGEHPPANHPAANSRGKGNASGVGN